MSRKTSPLAVSFVLLTGFLSGSPATAQNSYTYYPSAHITYFPRTDVPLTLKDILIQPPQLNFDSILFPSRLHFKVRNNRLLLTQIIEGVVEDGKTEKELWSSPFGAEPQKFTLKVTDADQSLSDSSGRVVWSETLKPGLIMDFDQAGFLHVLNADGKELGSAPVDKNAALAEHGVRINTDPTRQITSVYSGVQLVWSGPMPSNNRIQWGRAQGSPVSGIAPREYLPGTTINFQISRETGILTVSNNERHPLETVPAETLHLIVLSGDEKSRQDIRNYFLYHIPPVTTQVTLTAPGLIYAQYHTAGGKWAGEESIHALKVLLSFTDKRKPKTGLQIWTANFDQTGKRTGTFEDGLQIAEQN